MNRLNFLVIIFLNIAAATAVLFLNSCGGEEIPANLIEDSSGVDIDLTWSTGGSDEVSRNEADLDLYIYKGISATPVLQSATGSYFEEIILSDVYADAEYTVEVLFYGKNYAGTKNVDFTIKVSGVTVAKSVPASSYFIHSDEKLRIKIVKIKKQGDKYTVTKL